MKSVRLANSGFNVAFQRWGEGNPTKILCLHGWLDNSNSFSFLGPFLAERGQFEVVAVDHVGHGHSDHRSSPNFFSSYVGQVKGIMDALGWEKSHICGHSMGTAISIMFAGCYPERVNRLVLLEGLGPMSKSADGTARRLRAAIDAEFAAAERENKGLPMKKKHATIQSALDSRINVVSTYPGSQTLSQEAALAIVSRGAAMTAAEGDLLDMQDLTAGPVSFRHDHKLVLPSHIYLTEEQVLDFIGNIQSPTLALIGENGWPFDAALMDNRRSKFTQGLLSFNVLPGSHHLHLDPATAPAVADATLAFFIADSSPATAPTTATATTTVTATTTATATAV